MNAILLKFLYTHDLRIAVVATIKMIVLCLLVLKTTGLFFELNKSRSIKYYLLTSIVVLTGMQCISKPYVYIIFLMIYMLITPFMATTVKTVRYVMYIIFNMSIWVIAFNIVHNLWFKESFEFFLTDSYSLYIYIILSTMSLIGIYLIAFRVISFKNNNGSKVEKIVSIILSIIEIMLIYGVVSFSLKELKNKYNHSSGAYDDVALIEAILKSSV